METIVQAQPGWSVVILSDNESSGDEDIHLEPVIAWFVDYEDDRAYIVPITATLGRVVTSILQRPDGSFGDYYGNYVDKDEVIKCLYQRKN